MVRCIVSSLLIVLSVGACASAPDLFPSREKEEISRVAASLHESLQAAAREFGLRADVVVDENGVAHVAGENSRALYFAQGFVHAYFRLAQMEMVSRLVEGTRSEINGPSMLKSDRMVLRYGLDRAAKRSFEKIQADPETREVLAAYTAGVNAWISKLTPETTPIEMARNGVSPRKFEPVDTARIMTFISWALSDATDELKLTRTLGKIGSEKFQELFPWPDSDPQEGVFRATRQFSSKVPSKAWIDQDEEPLDISGNALLKPAPGTGSNAFVIRPERTESKAPLLGADFHANYVLPSTFLPMQLVSPELNAIGSSVPGVPMIITGTNGRVAWSYVSSMSDSYDWFRLDLDPKDPSRYKWNGAWKKFEIETIELRPRGAPVESFTRQISEAGEMVSAVRREGREIKFAYRWSGRDGVNAIYPFYYRLKMKSAKDCGDMKALAESAPLLLTCIDRSGQNGVWLTSRLPKRPQHQDPRVVSRASSDRDIWQGYYPASKNPSLFPLDKPAVLANQFSRSPAGDVYVGWKFSSPDRAVRIQQLLDENRNWTMTDVLDVLSDVTSARTEKIRPIFLDIAHRYVADAEGKASSCAKEAVGRLETWNGRYDAQSTDALFMNAWISLTENLIWGDRIGSKATYAWPPSWKIAELTSGQPNSPWWDYQHTPHLESREDLVRWSLENTCDYMKERREKDGATKLIDLSRPRFRTFSGIDFPNSTGLDAPGTSTTVFLQERSYGTVYRAVISLEETPKFWSIAIGGPSGHPGSSLSGSWMKAWAAQKILEVPVMKLEDFKTLEKR